MSKSTILYYVFDGSWYHRDRKNGRIDVHNKERLIVTTVGEDVLVLCQSRHFWRRRPFDIQVLTLARKFDVVQRKTVTRSRLIPSVLRARCQTPNVRPAPIELSPGRRGDGRWSLTESVTDDRLLILSPSLCVVSPSITSDPEDAIPATDRRALLRSDECRIGRKCRRHQTKSLT